MEELKYYTPEISELYVGYECEINSSLGKITVVNIRRGEENKSWELDLSEPIWNPYKVDEIPKDIERFLDKLRTPFLTKEQIKAEGWKIENVLIEDDDENDMFCTGFVKNIDKNHWYELVFQKDKIFIQYKWYRNSVTQLWRPVFYGKIKSINEFRTLLKQLEIC